MRLPCKKDLQNNQLTKNKKRCSYERRFLFFSLKFEKGALVRQCSIFFATCQIIQIFIKIICDFAQIFNSDFSLIQHISR